MIRLEIPRKLPSLNDYIKKCRGNKYVGAEMKKDVEQDIGWYINSLPVFEKPVKIHFYWIEGNKKRDLDNICFRQEVYIRFNG